MFVLQAFHFLSQVPAVIELDKLDDLHAHIRLIRHRSLKGEVAQISGFRVASRQEELGDIKEVV